MAIGFRAIRQAVRMSAMAVLLAMSISPALAIQDGSSPGLAITDSTGSRSGVFDAIVEPGGTATIPLQFRAGGDAPIAAESWIANATSAVNGGVLLSTREAVLEGPATWLDLEVGTITIEPDSPVDRPVTIQVPGNAEPGVYIAGIVIQAMQPVPIPDSDAAQVIRGTALVAIQVPGDIEAT
ncbi:MAG TPA: hypothetical protein VD767_03235, partial [Thermomicrobiales bacterium]|nr:hypothetical protein [Thermomicrobiales bacterium]